jgi:malate/lactate dehydrogenase
VERVIEGKLSDEELQALKESASIIKENTRLLSA